MSTGQRATCIVPVSRSRSHQFVSGFRRLGRRQVQEFFDPAYFCPEGTFKDPGIYIVTPTLTLPYDGASLGIQALTGVFVGSPGIIRRRNRSYVAQPLSTLFEASQNMDGGSHP